MKRNILLAFLLVGLVVMEWGCRKDCDEYETHRLVDLAAGFPSMDTSTVSHFPYSSGFIILIPKTEQVAAIQSANYSVIASVWPGCEIKTHISYVATIDSFSITTNKKYNDLVDTDLSKILCNPYNKDQVEQIMLSPIHPLYRLEYALSQPPNQTDTFEITFQFFDTDGNFFENTTDPVIITP